MTPPPVELPLPLRLSLELGECVLFLGAGIGKHLSRPNGTCLPDAPGLANDIAKHFSIDTKSDDLSKVAELVQIRGHKELPYFSTYCPLWGTAFVFGRYEGPKLILKILQKRHFFTFSSKTVKLSKNFTEKFSKMFMSFQVH